MKHWIAGLLFAVVVGGTFPCAQAQEKRPVRQVVIGGVEQTGIIDGFDHKLFWFIPQSTGERVPVQWAELDEHERKRIWQVLGIPPEGPAPPRDVPTSGPPAGKPDPETALEGVELTLDTGRVVTGLELKDQFDGKRVYLQSKSLNIVGIPLKKIRSRRAVKLREADVFTPLERYQRRKQEVNPSSALDWYKLGIFCVRLRLYDFAAENFERVTIIDPRWKDLLADHLALARSEMARQDAAALYRRMQRYRIEGRYGEALRAAEDLDRLHPDSQYATRAEETLPALRKLFDEHLKRYVLVSYYLAFKESCRRAVHNRISELEVPGWIIETEVGTFKGVVEDENDEAVFLRGWNPKTFRTEDTLNQISKDVITRRISVDLNPRKRLRTLEESIAYMTDPDGGISADIRARVAKNLRISEDQVREYWESRNRRIRVVDKLGIHSSKLYISYHTTYYGQGTFLRGIGTSRGPRALNVDLNGKDTGTWWRRLPFDTRENILRSIGADALMKTRATWYNCPVCAGKGKIRIHGITGGSTTRRCGHCFGVRRFAKIVYW